MAMSICPGCGVIAPTQRSQCKLCETVFGDERPKAPEGNDDRFWVRLVCRFRCRECGMWTPLSYIDHDGLVQCARCGMQQAYDVDVWREGLDAAHAVGDLHGPDPEGRRHGDVSIGDRNPFAEIGVSATENERDDSGVVMADGVVKTSSLHLRSSPGHPLCGQCRSVLDVKPDGSGSVTTRCRGCGEHASYELPQNTRGMHRGLDGAIADDYRTDRPDARVQSSSEGAVVALECPTCSAKLDPEPSSQFVTCSYCRTPCRIRSRTLSSMYRERAVAPPWWVLMRGPSKMRRELEQQARQQASAVPMRPPSGSDHEFAELEDKGGGRRLLWTGIVAVAVAAIGGFVAFGDRLGPSGDAGADEAATRADVASATTSADTEPQPEQDPDEPDEPPPPPPRRVFQPLQGCSCRANTDGEPGRELVQLAVRPKGKTVSLTSSGQHLTWKLEFYLDVGEDASHFLRTQDAEAAPPYELQGTKADVGVGCSNEVIAIAAGGRVSGWSTEDGSLLWTAAVDGWRPSEGQTNSLELSCKSLRVRRGVVRVPEVGRRAAKIRMETGEVL